MKKTFTQKKVCLAGENWKSKNSFPFSSFTSTPPQRNDFCLWAVECFWLFAFGTTWRTRKVFVKYFMIQYFSFLFSQSFQHFSSVKRKSLTKSANKFTKLLVTWKTFWKDASGSAVTTWPLLIFLFWLRYPQSSWDKWTLLSKQTN